MTIKLLCYETVSTLLIVNRIKYNKSSMEIIHFIGAVIVDKPLIGDRFHIQMYSENSRPV